MSNASKSGYITGTIWERVLIILFASALVFIGADHFKYPYGGIVNYVRSKVVQVGGVTREDSPYGFAAERARLRTDWPGGTDDGIGFERRNRSYSGGYFSDPDNDGASYSSREKRAKVIPVPEEVERAIKSGNVSRLPKNDEVGSSNRRELNRLLNDY